MEVIGVRAVSITQILEMSNIEAPMSPLSDFSREVVSLEQRTEHS